MYLDEPGEVSLTSEGMLDEIPKAILLYLQKRFRAISVLGDEGFEKVWPK
jgi:hypothetical protein